MVGERNVVQIDAVVVGVERRPAAVLVLHPQEPAEPALLGQPRAIGIHTLDPLQGHEDHGGVVEVRVVGIVVLERPAAGCTCGRFTCQSPGISDLLGSIQSAARCRRGDRAADRSIRALTASEVSHTGEGQGCT